MPSVGWGMSEIVRLQDKLGRLSAQRFGRHMRRLDLPVPIVSFSFDDYPRSALVNGGAILEDEGARGTFYASFGLAGTQMPAGAIGTAEELASCVQNGHELGCHTFTHLRCAATPAASIAADLWRNIEAGAAAAGKGRIRNFAYPDGAASAGGKVTVMRCFDSARSIDWGINRGSADLGFLRAVPVYGRHDGQVWQRYLSELQRASGWLIFYTHDVTDNPSPFGCAPAELRRVVHAVREAGATILTVADSLAQAMVDGQ